VAHTPESHTQHKHDSTQHNSLSYFLLQQWSSLPCLSDTWAPLACALLSDSFLTNQNSKTLSSTVFPSPPSSHFSLPTTKHEQKHHRTPFNFFHLILFYHHLLHFHSLTNQRCFHHANPKKQP